MGQSRAVASRLKHVCDMLREIETILFSGDLTKLATKVACNEATKVAPCMVAFTYTLTLMLYWVHRDQRSY